MSMHSRPNSWVAVDDDSTTTLTYGLQVNPAPLTVSTAGESPVLGSLEFVVTNPTSNPIAVTSVAFSFSVGTVGTSLTPTTANVGTQVSDTTTWMVQSPGIVTSGLATYTMKPQTGSTGNIPPHSSVVVQIFNFQTVQVAGNTTVIVKEVIGQSSGFVNFQVTTFPTGFYFNGLSANVASGSVLTPVAQVPSGSAVTLVWNSSIVSLTSFKIFYSNASQGQQTASPTDTGEWLSPPLTSDTVFTVVVTVAIADGAPLSAALSTAVSVQNPALIAASITAGTATINGPATITGALGAGAITATGLTVNNSATITGGGALTATAATINGIAVITGNLSAGQSAVAGLNVGSTQAPNNNAAISVPLAISSSLAALRSAQSVNSGKTYTASTDGFVVGSATSALINGNAGKFSLAWVYGTCSNGLQVWATVGNTMFFSNWMCINNQCFMMPVPSGSTFSVTVILGNGSNQINPTLAFSFIPFGSSAPIQLTEIGEAPPPPEPPGAVRVITPEARLLQAVAEILLSVGGEEQKARLGDLLHEAFPQT